MEQELHELMLAEVNRLGWDDCDIFISACDKGGWFLCYDDGAFEEGYKHFETLSEMIDYLKCDYSLRRLRYPI